MQSFISGRVRKIAVLGLAASLVGAACSSSSKPSSAGSSGSAYTVMFEQTLSGPQATPSGIDAVPAFHAAFQGTSAKLVVCDDLGTDAGNVDCQHEAVVDHVAVLITGHQVDESIANSAGIPVVGVTDATSPVSFEISGAPALFAGMAVALYNKGCRRLGFVVVEGGQTYETQVAKAEPWQSVTVASIPLDAPDLAAPVAKLSSANVQCIAAVTLPSQITQLVIAAHQGDLKVPIIVPGIVVTPQIIQAMGSLGNGLLEVISSPDPSIPNADVTAAANKIRAYQASAAINQSSVFLYAFCQIVLDGVRSVHGNITAASMLTALNGLRNASTGGIVPPISMVPRALPNDRRDFDTNIQTYTIENAALSQPSGWFNVGPELDRAVG